MSAVAARLLRRRAAVEMPPPPDPPRPDEAEYVALPTDAGALWLPRADRRMLPYVRSRGAWDEPGAQLLRTVVRGGFTMLDAGAGAGYHSVLAWRISPDVRVHCCEASPAALPLLRWNLWFNGVPAPGVHPVLLGDAAGVAYVRPVEGDVLRLERFADPVPGAQRVDVVRGDDLLAGVDVDVVRVALDGWEREAVAGLLGTVARAPRSVVLVSFWPSRIRARGADPHDVLRAYRDWGFDRTVAVAETPTRLDDDGVVLTCDNAGPAGRVHLVLR